MHVSCEIDSNYPRYSYPKSNRNGIEQNARLKRYTRSFSTRKPILALNASFLRQCFVVLVQGTDDEIVMHKHESYEETEVGDD